MSYIHTHCPLGTTHPPPPGMSLKFVQLIQHFEHLASPLAEALLLSCRRPVTTSSTPSSRFTGIWLAVLSRCHTWRQRLLTNAFTSWRCPWKGTTCSSDCCYGNQSGSTSSLSRQSSLVLLSLSSSWSGLSFRMTVSPNTSSTPFLIV